MPWYIWVGTYAVGWMITFRVWLLNSLDYVQRELAKPQHKRDGQTSDRDVKFGQHGIPVTAAFIWPLLLIGYGLKFIMFPRGIKTKFDREQEAKERARKAEAELEEARALLKSEGIIV